MMEKPSGEKARECRYKSVNSSPTITENLQKRSLRGKEPPFLSRREGGWAGDMAASGQQSREDRK
jgi:hypothetical protein